MMSDFEKELHAMFDHIWDCEIDHTVFQDTVGELMEAVIQTYEKHKPTLSTNLAEVGTDCISRQAAIDALNEVVKDHSITDFDAIASILDLPPAQPEIIRCCECKFASGDSRICMKFDHSPIGELDFVHGQKGEPMSDLISRQAAIDADDDMIEPQKKKGEE